MIKTNEYYKVMYHRESGLRQNGIAIFHVFTMSARIILGVFLKRNMGIRHFNLFHCIRIMAVLCVLPMFMPMYRGCTLGDTLFSCWGWYLFLTAFAKFTWDRYKECRRPEGYFDFNHFSRSEGDSLPSIENFEFFGSKLSERIINVYVEPLLASVVGLAFLLLGQWIVGTLILVCAGIYSLYYMSAYALGRNELLDRIDEDIYNRAMSDTFLDDKPSTTNFKFYGPKPSTQEARDGFARLFSKDDGADRLGNWKRIRPHRSKQRIVTLLRKRK